VKSSLSSRRQVGMVLLVSLLVLLLLGVIASTAARTGLLQLHMAGNDAAGVGARQHALAALDAVVADTTMMPAHVEVGYTICDDRSTLPDCDEHGILLEPGIRPAIGDLSVSVVRIAPLESRLPVTAEATASSAVFYRVAKFEIRASYDATARGLGRARLVQGVFARTSAITGGMQ